MRRPGVEKRWTDEECKQLRDWVEGGKTLKDCAALLGRTTGSVNNKAGLLGLRSRFKPDEWWTAERLAKLRELRTAGFTWAQIVEKLGRSEGTCRRMARTLGFKRAPQATNGRAWTPEEDQHLLDMMTAGWAAAQVAERLGRTIYAIKARWGMLSGHRGGYQEKPKPKDDEIKMRRCLGRLCGGVMFQSEHSGHRMCERCVKHCSGVHMGHV